MNIGYTKFGWNEVDKQVCPICGKNIYVHKRGNDYACADTECALGHGARELINKVKVILKMMEIG
jgi:hypothetical protein